MRYMHLFALGAIALFMSGCASGVPSTTSTPSGRCGADLDSSRIADYAESAVVYVRTNRASGTGWIVDDPRLTDAAYIVTNHHVIAESTGVVVSLKTRGGQTLATPAEPVKYDAERDLALLAVPRLSDLHPGLVIDRRVPSIGSEIAVLGFPGGYQGDLTLEPGSITTRGLHVVGGGEYLPTNANINPGNSGGPVVDACGNAVGTVVATGIGTERKGLAIPSRDVSQLIDSYVNPPAPEQTIRNVADAFYSAIRRGNVAEGCWNTFSSEFLVENYIPILKQIAQKLNQRIVNFGQEQGLSQQTPALEAAAAALSETELMVWALWYMYEGGVIPAEQAVVPILAFSLNDALRLGNRTLLDYEIHDVRVFNDGTGEAYVTGNWQDARRTYRDRIRLGFRYHWGAWGIDDMEWR